MACYGLRVREYFGLCKEEHTHIHRRSKGVFGLRNAESTLKKWDFQERERERVEKVVGEAKISANLNFV